MDNVEGLRRVEEHLRQYENLMRNVIRESLFPQNFPYWPTRDSYFQNSCVLFILRKCLPAKSLEWNLGVLIVILASTFPVKLQRFYCSIFLSFDVGFFNWKSDLQQLLVGLFV